MVIKNKTTKVVVMVMMQCFLLVALFMSLSDMRNEPPVCDRESRGGEWMRHDRGGQLAH